MKVPKSLLIISIFYYLINGILLYQTNHAEGGAGLIPYVILLIFQAVMVVIVGILTIILKGRWLKVDASQLTIILLLSYLFVPLLILFYMDF